MYKAITKFIDLQDNAHTYHEGDIFPREGLIVPRKRLKELSSNRNKRGIPVIKFIKEEE